VVAAALALLALSGCAAGGWDAPRPAPSPLGSPGPGFLPSAAPAPESTIAPEAGSWDGVHPPDGYRVVLLSAGDDAPTRAVVDAVRSWADAEHVDLRTVEADTGNPIAGIVTALDMNADLVVAAGNDLVDALAVVSANH